MPNGWGGAWDGGAGAASAAGHGDIYDWVRHKLQKTTAELPDTEDGLVRETGAVVSALRSRYPCLADYASLSGRDRQRFDEAAGLLAAARLRPVLLAGANAGKGTVRREQVGTNETEYQSAGDAKKPLEEQWTDEAAAVLRGISCIGATARRQAADAPVFGVWGRQRGGARGGGF